MDNISEATIEYAVDVIRAAEEELGKLTQGQRRDLLADNFDLSLEDIHTLVDYIKSNGLV